MLTPDLLEPVERVDAVVSGTELGLDLAEELAALEPCGMGNPAPRLLVPGRAVRRRPDDGGGSARPVLGQLRRRPGPRRRLRL